MDKVAYSAVKMLMIGQKNDVDDGTGYDADDHPNSDNLFNFSSDLECGRTCTIWTVIANLMLFSHLFTMVGPMNGWANGNFLLLLKTCFTVA